jgi:Kef-type K+ transport system membrane component KefB
LERLAPGVSAALFPKTSFGSFEVLSTIGLILFLFLIGMELDIDQIYHQRATAMVASGMSILFPFAMALLLAHPLRVRFAPDGIGSIPFVLFLGIAMSITAFPVLARILEERQLQKSALGTTAILCAAVDDVVAWMLLAVALAFLGHGGESRSLPLRLFSLAVYVVVMLGVIRPLAAKLAAGRGAKRLSLELLGVVVAGALLSAAATDAIGVHPLFGAFLAGLCFPRIDQWRTAIRARLVVAHFWVPLQMLMCS